MTWRIWTMSPSGFVRFLFCIQLDEYRHCQLYSSNFERWNLKRFSMLMRSYFYKQDKDATIALNIKGEVAECFSEGDVYGSLVTLACSLMCLFTQIH